ncbi:hypothetical protein AM588_10010145 [Phytophthora nicotianae]|uniref:Uncharacterized protein n=1 Tax=Phytophthora nicotianae TaxID=4792 RepID=A0A0W8DTW9_PHYNI|nr:hypothetical protein AM588_10010145 [Phytophthora nicotianae]
MVLDDTPNEHHPLKTNVQQHAQPPSVSGPRQLRLQRQRGATFVAFVGFGLASWILTNDIMRSPDFARRVYQWNGLATQVGAMSGTAVAFPLVFWCESLFTT